MDLETNLRYVQDGYAAILAEHAARVDRLASVRGSRFRRVERLHSEYIQRPRAEVDALLDRLAAIKAATGSP